MSDIVVRLAPGKLGFYDKYTNLHLYYPQKIEDIVKEDANLIGIRKAVKSGRIIDVNNTLSEKKAPVVETTREIVSRPVVAEPAEPVPHVEEIYEPVAKEPVEPEPQIEEMPELVVEKEIVKEQVKKKEKRNKKGR